MLEIKSLILALEWKPAVKPNNCRKTNFELWTPSVSCWKGSCSLLCSVVYKRQINVTCSNSSGKRGGIPHTVPYLHRTFLKSIEFWSYGPSSGEYDHMAERSFVWWKLIVSTGQCAGFLLFYLIVFFLQHQPGQWQEAQTFVLYRNITVMGLQRHRCVSAVIFGAQLLATKKLLQSDILTVQLYNIAPSS